MLALEVNALLSAIARTRAAYGPMPGPAGLPPFRTLRREGSATHVIIDSGMVESILADHRTFLQADIHAAISAIDSAGALSRIRYFLSHNPIGMNGPAHKEARAAFLALFTDASRRLGPAWRAQSGRVFAEAMTGRFGAPVSFARHATDGMIEVVISHHAPDFPPRRLVDAGKVSARSVFGYVHSLGRLATEEASLAALCGDIDLPADARDSLMPMLLSLLVQGRDPMIGTMAAFLNHLLSLPEPARRTAIAQASVGEVFRNAAAVNYTGRIAAAAFSRDGLEIAPGEAVLLILSPLAEQAPVTDLSFGAGRHRCAGKALAYQMLGIWLDDLKLHADALPWQGFVPDIRMPGVFEDYRPAS